MRVSTNKKLIILLIFNRTNIFQHTYESLIFKQIHYRTRIKIYSHEAKER